MVGGWWAALRPTISRRCERSGPWCRGGEHALGHDRLHNLEIFLLFPAHRECILPAGTTPVIPAGQRRPGGRKRLSAAELVCLAVMPQRGVIYAQFFAAAARPITSSGRAMGGRTLEGLCFGIR